MQLRDAPDWLAIQKILVDPYTTLNGGLTKRTAF
jgi:hypothetical protein